MREVKHYICDICHTEYADRDKAIACEKSHKLIKGICEQVFRPAGFDNSKASAYPVKVRIMMSDGFEIWYKRMC